PMTIIFKEHRGSYYKTKQPMDEIYEGLLEMGVKTTKGVGIYYDDPAQTPVDQLRSDVGSILPEEYSNKLPKIKDKFEVKQYGRHQAVVVEFPARTMLSYMIAPMRVYPVINEVFQENGYDDFKMGIEIYDVPNKQITYIAPIEDPQMTKNEQQEDTNYGYTDLSPAEAKTLIEQNSDLIVIDVSPNYDEGHLPGAVNYYLGDGSLEEAIPTLDKEKTYLVYCHVESVSMQGAQMLIDAGFESVYRLDGDYSAWVEAGYEVER
ncbi:MAG: hypothetical protein GF390_00645, partial [Candidatus Pacebacteria bacterium]|nr:hypothetical protein [Candidatus Paceibacterota bacterium]